MLEIFRIVIVLFQVDNKDERSHFFEKTFLLTDISMVVVFEILFLTLSNVKVNFND